MKKYFFMFILSAFLTFPAYSAATGFDQTIKVAPYTSTQETSEKLTPEQALKRLMEGNNRFVGNNSITRNLLQQAKSTSLKGQFPSAVILSCMDSRGSPELIFDQGLGDVFSVRVAGNVIDLDQLGGMEYATKVIGSKLIVIMGHTQCGAVQGACQQVALGNLTELLEKIHPAVQIVKNHSKAKINCDDKDTVDEIAKQNVLIVMKQIREKSPLINAQIENKQVLLVGAMHHLARGDVTFFNEKGEEIK